MEAFLDYIADHPGFVFEILLIPPAVAVFREDGYDTIGRVAFAFWLAGYAISLLVLVQVMGFLAGSDLRRFWLAVITLFSLLVLCPCLYFISCLSACHIHPLNVGSERAAWIVSHGRSRPHRPAIPSVAPRVSATVS